MHMVDVVAVRSSPTAIDAVAEQPEVVTRFLRRAERQLLSGPRPRDLSPYVVDQE